MNFYKNIYNKKIFNYSTLLNYTIKYISFIKLNNSIKNNADLKY